MLTLPRMTVWSHAPEIAIRGRRNVPAEIVGRDAVFGTWPVELPCDFSRRRSFYHEPPPLLAERMGGNIHSSHRSST